MRCVIKIPIHISAQDGTFGQFLRRNLRRTSVGHTGNFVPRRKLLTAWLVRERKHRLVRQTLYVPLPVFFAFSECLDDWILGHSGHYGALCCLSSLPVGLNGAFRGTLTDSDQNCGALWGLLGPNRATVKIATLCDELRHSGSSQPQGPLRHRKNCPKGSFWAVICRRSSWETNAHYHPSRNLPVKNRPL